MAAPRFEQSDGTDSAWRTLEVTQQQSLPQLVELSELELGHSSTVEHASLTRGGHRPAHERREGSGGGGHLPARPQ
eukprot:scaffold298849_cov36-Tisochrysis_lutea.AAC.1